MAIIIFISLKIFQQRHILDLCNLRIMDKTGKVDAAILGIIDKINQLSQNVTFLLEKLVREVSFVGQKRSLCGWMFRI